MRISFIHFHVVVYISRTFLTYHSVESSVSSSILGDLAVKVILKNGKNWWIESHVIENWGSELWKSCIVEKVYKLF